MASPKLNLVVAACNNGGIGIDGRIPWRIKQDMSFFRKITSTTKDPEKQNAVVMGRKTWLSIPEKFRPMPNRLNVILSREMTDAPSGTYLARHFSDAIDLLTKGKLAEKVESIFIIGGSAVYEEAMSGKYPCQLYLTRVLGDFTCDTFIPNLEDTDFQKVPNPDNIPSETLHENDIDFRFEVYEKL